MNNHRGHIKVFGISKAESEHIAAFLCEKFSDAVFNSEKPDFFANEIHARIEKSDKDMAKSLGISHVTEINLKQDFDDRDLKALFFEMASACQNNDYPVAMTTGGKIQASNVCHLWSRTGLQNPKLNVVVPEK